MTTLVVKRLKSLLRTGECRSVRLLVKTAVGRPPTDDGHFCHLRKSMFVITTLVVKRLKSLLRTGEFIGVHLLAKTAAGRPLTKDGRPPADDGHFCHLRKSMFVVTTLVVKRLKSLLRTGEL